MQKIDGSPKSLRESPKIKRDSPSGLRRSYHMDSRNKIIPFEDNSTHRIERKENET